MEKQQKQSLRKILIEPGVTTQKYTARGQGVSRSYLIVDSIIAKSVYISFLSVFSCGQQEH